MHTNAQDPWIAFRKPRPAARLRLFCFPYAGGSALIYRPRGSQIAPDIDVFPVQLPGRGKRLREPSFTRVAPLVDAMHEVLTPYFDRPFAFFGHSMGALLAYELTHRLRREGRALPVHLLLSARRAPHLPPKQEPYYDLPDDEFLGKLGEMNGTPEEVLANEELMELMLPLIRADFELNDTHDSTGYPQLSCPFTAFGGVADPEVERSDLEPWRELTEGKFRLRMFPGDHFFLHPGEGTLLAAIGEELQPHLR